MLRIMVIVKFAVILIIYLSTRRHLATRIVIAAS